MALDPTLLAGMPQDQPLGDVGEIVDQMADSGEYDEPDEDDNPDGPIGGVEPENLPNYAADEEVVKMIQEDVLTYVRMARDNRKAKIEDDWDRYRDIYNCRRDVSYYAGRSKLFIPAVRKAVDTLVRISKDAIFSDPYLGIETDIPKYKDIALDLMKWMLEDQGKLRDKMPMFLRQLYQIGTSCLKLTWEKTTRQVRYREWNQEDGISEIKTRDECDHYGPKIDVVDMKCVHVWPETQVDYDGLRIVFEDALIKKADLERGVEDGLYDAFAVKAAIDQKSQSLAQDRITHSQASKEGLGDTKTIPKDSLDITYGWAKCKLPGQEFEQWNQFIYLNDNPKNIIRIAENPWWFQKPNYLFGMLFQEHDYFYGHGIVEMTEMWQYMVNDVVNQTMDTGTFTLNPIVSYDPGMVDDPDELEIQPMAKWPTGPKGVEIIRPPVELALQGVQMIQFLMNVIQESSDAPAIVQGNPKIGQGPAVSTATGVSQIFQATNSSIIDQVESLQNQVLTPLAQYTEIMAHEFMDEAMVIRKVGDEGVVVTQRIIRPQDLNLSLDVRWVASNRLREKSAKIQQLINFLNIGVKIPPEVMQQQGFQINLKEIIKDIYSGLGLPDTDRIILDVTNTLPGIPPEMEHELLEAGRRVIASPYDTPESHMAHLQAHMMYRPKSELTRVRLVEHIASTYQAMQQAVMQQQAMMQAASGQGGMPAGKGAPGTSNVVPGAGERPQEMPQSEEPSDQLAGILNQITGNG